MLYPTIVPILEKLISTNTRVLLASMPFIEMEDAFKNKRMTRHNKDVARVGKFLKNTKSLRSIFQSIKIGFGSDKSKVKMVEYHPMIGSHHSLGCEK